MTSAGDLAALAATMTSAARELLAALDQWQRSAAQGPLPSAELTRWTYFPGSRPGVRLGDLTFSQLELASALLASSYGEEGLATAERVLAVEAHAQGLDQNPAGSTLLTRFREQDYWLRILGQPGGREPWAWRLSGHHLVAQATVLGSQVSTTPQFFGVNPARVPSGPHAGLRGLADEEDLARRLVTLLDEDQRERAVQSRRAPADILTRDDPVAQRPRGLTGLPMSGMDAAQSQLFEALIGSYLGRASAPVANRAWTDLKDSGLGAVAFAWAGGLRPGEGHYYAVLASTLLIEYDNTQDDANHIHSVWRDLAHDWGGDLLAQHYRGQHLPTP